ncbi:MAG: V-type ATP synthase subunit A [Myxococcota bacterium]
MSAGSIIRVSGPTVTARGLVGAALGDLVRVGAAALLGEVIRLQGDLATLQVYEDTTGLSLGEPVVGTGMPLTVELGPGLLGQVFDGVQRPLPALAAGTGDFIGRGGSIPALDRQRRWRFHAAVKPGDRVEAGAVVGEVAETASLVHRVLVPPGMGGTVREVREGELTVTDPAVVLDDGQPITLLQRWPAKRARPFRRRLPATVPLLTGQRVLDCLFPVAVGGTAVLPGGFGTGKTVLEQTLAKFTAADIVIFVGCGERGNELTELLAELPTLQDPRTGAPLAERMVFVVNTSNMPVAAREASIYTGITIAEYFRDMGYQAALLADSTSRWAEALREISSRLEEMPGEEGYPTYLAARLARFYERAGRVVPLSGDGAGAVTLVGAVSPPGGDFSEPVTQASLRIAGALWALSVELAQQRHFPAVDWGQSFSLYVESLEPWMREQLGSEWLALRDEALRLLQAERQLAELVQLVGTEGIPDEERLVLEAARLLREGVLRQSALSERDASCPPAKTLWMLRLLIHFRRTAERHLKAGVPLARIVGGPVGERLLRLAEVPPDEIEQVGAGLLQQMEHEPGGGP